MSRSFNHEIALFKLCNEKRRTKIHYDNGAENDVNNLSNFDNSNIYDTDDMKKISILIFFIFVIVINKKEKNGNANNKYDESHDNR